jgi:hypothetical protein
MIPFHRFLIGTAILFCAGFAAWALASFRSDGSPLTLVLGIGFGLGAAVLGYYLKNLRRFLGR